MIEALGLTRRFGQFVAVEDVSLRVPAGSLLTLLGPNGAGKTTTVRMLAGLLAPSAGEATVAGCDVRHDPAGVRTRVGLVTDAPGLYEQMTLPAYLDFFGGMYGLDQSTRTRRIAELIDFFELGAHRRERLSGFSKGMKQKVALARALVHDPPVLFLDEPTSGLDPLSARAVRDLLVGLKARNRAIVLCTHDLDEAECLADEVAIVRRGRIVASDAPAALLANGSHDTHVRIDLAAPGPATEAILAALDGVSVPTPVQVLEEADGMVVVRYHTTDPRRFNPRVVARLVAAGARIVGVRCEARTLEEAYAAAIGADTSPSVASNAVWDSMAAPTNTRK